MIFQTFYPNGQIHFEYNIENEKKEGTYRSYYETGQLKVVCEFKNGVKNGEYISYYSNGLTEIKSMYVDGKESGVETWFYPSGRIWLKCNYKEGKRDGDYKEWLDYATFLYKDEKYKDGYKHGVCKEYRHDGVLIINKIYELGKVVEKE